MRGLIRFSMGLLVALALMTSCGSDQVSEGEVGHLNLTLQSTGPSGVLYQLRSATFDIESVAGTGVQESVSSEDNLGDPSIDVTLANGPYRLTLQDGWSMEHSANSVPFSPIPAELVSANPVFVDVVANQVTSVTFVFQVDADTIVFGSGTISLDFDVDEVTSLTVFVSNTGGVPPFAVTTLDTFCQGEADRAGLSGTFRAWLSTSTYSPWADWADWDVVGRDYRFVRPDGVEIASSWQDLADGELAAAPSLKADGTAVGDDTPQDFEVWTGTVQGGFRSDQTCDDWTTRDPAEQALVGDARFNTREWTRARTVPCDDIYNRRWYCFEQPTSAQP
jgi:hypothetical protein